MAERACVKSVEPFEAEALLGGGDAPQERHLEDAERATVFWLHELSIKRTAHEAAQEMMG